MWPTFATRKGAGFKLLNSPGSGPQRAGEKKTAPPGATEKWETLEEMGLVVGQVLVRMSQARNNMVLMSIDSVLVLLVLTHICAR